MILILINQVDENLFEEMCYNYKNLQYVKIYSMKIAIMKYPYHIIYLNIHIKIQIKKTIKKSYVYTRTNTFIIINNF